MPVEDLDVPGLWNARDLGGVRCEDGVVQPGRLVRSEAPWRVDDDGWSRLVAHGVRTVVDLRTTEEAAGRPSNPGSADVDLVPAPLEDGLAGDEELDAWTRSGLLGTPLYYGRFVRRWPERCLAAVRAVADARPGGVLVHCAGGGDRSGMVVAMVLQVCGARRDDVVADYAATERRTAATGGGELPAEATAVRRLLADHGFDGASSAMTRVLDTEDLLGPLRRAGLRPEEETALRARLLAPSAG
ncbi:tyrosine-protein phosphatase [Pseudokineococcus sp. 1T1Z-3]|uniref:tyrosine-protein phosphatase n=1 Tax=Pseudokineococcus sp. 1T1Z-3 TaxID=3132745 RepID=UPI0030B79971